MTAEYALLVDALSVAVAGKNKKLDLQVEWSSFLKLAASHGVLALVCDGIRKAEDAWEQVPQEYQNKLDGAYMKAFFRETQMEHIHQLLEQKLQENKVPHVFLKGILLKHAYPEPALRTMSDMDILVYAEDFDTIARVAQELEGKPLPGDGNHRNYVFPGKVAVEFHPNLLHHATPVGTDINPGWQYVKASAGPSKELTEEGFYLNTICHLANHFVDGGVGIRFILDVWVNRHLREPKFDREFVERELERFGLLGFTHKIEHLSEVWFGTEDSNELMEELGEYILTSGSHGIPERAMLNAVSLSPGGNRRSALWGKIFYPKAELEDRFPWCKGRPLLLPAAWLVRAFKAVTTHGSVIRKWNEGTSKVTDEAATEQKEKLARFGIHRKKR